MEIRLFYTSLLGLTLPWVVKEARWDEKGERVDVHLECTQGAEFPCPHCHRSSPVCESLPLKVWRHLDTCGVATYLHARPPIADCPVHGRQPVPLPWADKDSPFTLPLEQLLTGLGGKPGDIRKAGRFLRVESVHVDRMLQRGDKKTERVEHTGEASARQGPPETTARAPARQASLFEQNDMSFANRGIQAFRNMELEKAVELLQTHRSLYPKGYDVSSWLAAADFLFQGIGEAPAKPSEQPGYLCLLWNSYEDYVKSEHTGREVLISGVKTAFFSRAIEAAKQCGAMDFPLLPGGIAPGYLLLQAGHQEEAIRSLQSSIAKVSHDAALYGYLGDAYRLRGDERVARQCYREACLIDAAGLDWRHIQDEDLKELQRELLFVHESNLELALAWLPSHARINGLFERKAVRLHDGLKQIIDDYLEIEKSWQVKKSPVPAARLFFRGIILSENQEYLKFIKKIDIIRVRRTMKDINPELFADFLEAIVEGDEAGQRRGP